VQFLLVLVHLAWAESYPRPVLFLLLEALVLCLRLVPERLVLLALAQHLFDLLLCWLLVLLLLLDYLCQGD
jgi:hypothetical protein